jgi:hypothetical protein
MDRACSHLSISKEMFGGLPSGCERAVARFVPPREASVRTNRGAPADEVFRFFVGRKAGASS